MKKIPVQNRKRVAMQTALLRILYVSGILATALVAPKLTRLLPAADRSKARRAEMYARINQATARLRQRGYISIVDGRVKLSDRGMKSIEKILVREYRIPEQVHWDGKWRMLLFDIREPRRKTREQLRRLLNAAGFVRLQDSAWIYPFPCDEFVTLVRAHLASGVGELRSMVIEALESDRVLREHFHLS